LTRAPLILFVLSLLFGLVIAAVTPPFRGADEPAHFLRAYGYARGDILASGVDAQGRRGLLLPAELHDDFEFFRKQRYRAGLPGFSYRESFAEHAKARAERRPGDARPPVFVLYEGSESYAPTVYLPYIPVAWLGHHLAFDFLAQLYLMRAAGVLVLTAIAAVAIRTMPFGQWGLLAIAMLPSALCGRSIVSADGATFSYTLMVVALCAAAAWSAATAFSRQRAFWMTMCILAKPPQVALSVLELLARRSRQQGSWRVHALVALPGLVLLVLWLFSVGAEMGAWRMTEGYNLPAEQFSPVWKLSYMLQQPWHFPHQLWGRLSDIRELWQQLIGILGWLDVPLRASAYPVLSVLVLLACLEQGSFGSGSRTWVALVSAATILGYIAAVFLIFYLAWTPVAEAEIQGVQGRYFVVLLPVLLVFLAATLPFELPRWALAGLALASGVFSGAAVLEALIRFDWLADPVARAS
jgi:uncharacterized membrane protein